MQSSLDFSLFNILVADDVDLNRVLVEKMLGAFNFKVRKARNGLECMKEMYDQKPDLLLLDIIMPLMDGFEVIQAVRENPDWADVRIVVLSAINTNEDIVKAFNLGANDFITKPILMDKLMNTVACQLGFSMAEATL